MKELHLIKDVSEFKDAINSNFDIRLLYKKNGYDFWTDRGWTNELLNLIDDYGNDDTDFIYKSDYADSKDFIQKQDLVTRLRELDDLSDVQVMKETYKEAWKLLQECNENECIAIQDNCICEKIEYKNLVEYHSDAHHYALGFYLSE